MRKIQFYSFREIAEVMHVSVGTIRNWHHQKLFKIEGYVWVKGRKKIALVSEREFKLLIFRKLIKPRAN